MQNVDQLFRDFAIGDFAVLYGSPLLISLASLLGVRAQLLPQLGGVRSKVVFINSGNTFRPYQIAHLAKLHQLNPPKEMLRNDESKPEQLIKKSINPYARKYLLLLYVSAANLLSPEGYTAKTGCNAIQQLKQQNQISNSLKSRKLDDRQHGWINNNFLPK